MCFPTIRHQKPKMLSLFEKLYIYTFACYVTLSHFRQAISKCEKCSQQKPCRKEHVTLPMMFDDTTKCNVFTETLWHTKVSQLLHITHSTTKMYRILPSFSKH